MAGPRRGGRLPVVFTTCLGGRVVLLGSTSRRTENNWNGNFGSLIVSALVRVAFQWRCETGNFRSESRPTHSWLSPAKRQLMLRIGLAALVKTSGLIALLLAKVKRLG